MRTFLTRFALISMFLVSLLGAGASAALAAPGSGSGAVQDPMNGPITIHDCSYDNGTDTTCVVAQGEQHSVCTSVGTCNSQLNFSSYCLLLIDDVTGDTVASVCAQAHLQFHTDPSGTDQVDHESITETITGGSDGSCTMTSQFHEANGQVQYDNSTPSCF